jgi:hypothetical protein
MKLSLPEAPLYFDGQRLTAADLTAAQTLARELAWLHNRSLHGWGVADGLAVSGARGERQVQVMPGYALDALGRELVLNAPLTLPIPAIAGTAAGGAALYYLTASYADPAETVVRAGACGTSGAVRALDRPTVRWQDPTDTAPSGRYRYGLDVVLAEIHVRNCVLYDDVSTQGQRDAAPPQQPYVAAGRTGSRQTSWRLWPSDTAPQGVATTVPTEAAGFQDTPAYQAHVVGARMAYQTGGRAFAIDGYVQVAQATPQGFELRVLLPAGSTVGTGQAYTVTRDDYLAIAKRPLGMVMAGNADIAANILLQWNGPRLFVGQRMVVLDAPFITADPLTQAEFKGRFERIAEDNQTTAEALMRENGFAPGAAWSLSIDQVLAVPGDSMPLNPPDVVLKPDFLARLKTELGWHVVWTGIEG